MDKSVISLSLDLTRHQCEALEDAIESWCKHTSDHNYTLTTLEAYARALRNIKQRLAPDDNDSVE